MRRLISPVNNSDEMCSSFFISSPSIESSMSLKEKKKKPLFLSHTLENAYCASVSVWGSECSSFFPLSVLFKPARREQLVGGMVLASVKVINLIIKMDL